MITAAQAANIQLWASGGTFPWPRKTWFNDPSYAPAGATINYGTNGWIASYTTKQNLTGSPASRSFGQLNIGSHILPWAKFSYGGASYWFVPSDWYDTPTEGYGHINTSAATAFGGQKFIAPPHVWDSSGTTLSGWLFDKQPDASIITGYTPGIGSDVASTSLQFAAEAALLAAPVVLAAAAAPGVGISNSANVGAASGTVGTAGTSGIASQLSTTILGESATSGASVAGIGGTTVGASYGGALGSLSATEAAAVSGGAIGAGIGESVAEPISITNNVGGSVSANDTPSFLGNPPANSSAAVENISPSSFTPPTNDTVLPPSNGGSTWIDSFEKSLGDTFSPQSVGANVLKTGESLAVGKAVQAILPPSNKPKTSMPHAESDIAVVVPGSASSGGLLVILALVVVFGALMLRG